MKIPKSFRSPKVGPGPHAEKGSLRSHDAAAHRQQFSPVTIWGPPLIKSWIRPWMGWIAGLLYQFKHNNVYSLSLCSIFFSMKTVPTIELRVTTTNLCHYTTKRTIDLVMELLFNADVLLIMGMIGWFCTKWSYLRYLEWRNCHIW